MLAEIKDQQDKLDFDGVMGVFYSESDAVCLTGFKRAIGQIKVVADFKAAASVQMPRLKRDFEAQGAVVENLDGRTLRAYGPLRAFSDVIDFRRGKVAGTTLVDDPRNIAPLNLLAVVAEEQKTQCRAHGARNDARNASIEKLKKLGLRQGD